MKRLVFAPLALLATLASAQFNDTTTPIPKDLKKGFDSITIGDGKKFLGYLAGPECEGRGTGEPGYQKAAEYMAKNFKEFGLKSVMPDGSFFQYNDFWRIRVNPATLTIKNERYVPKADEMGAISNGTTDYSGDAIYLLAKGKAPGMTDDIKKMVDGKIVFFRNESENRNLDRQIANAGVKAVIILQDEVDAPSWAGRPSKPGASSAVPRLALTQGAFAKLLSSEEASAIKGFTEPDKLYYASLQSTFTAKSDVEVETIKVANVVGLLEGSDPVLKNEYIGVGAHLDHLGKRGKTIYYGADDDGSGSAAVLQVAKALSRNPIKPKRSVLFMAFYGEEMGLLGSRFLSDNSPVPLDNMVAELQMDMVGRRSDGMQNGDPKRIDKADENMDTIRLVGSKRISTELDKIIQDTNQHIGFKFKYDAEDVYTRSDHYNFARKGIPIAFFFTGFHPDYHQPTDTIEKIDFAKIANTAKLVYLTIHKIAERPDRLPKDVGGN